MPNKIIATVATTTAAIALALAAYVAAQTSLYVILTGDGLWLTVAR